MRIFLTQIASYTLEDLVGKAALTPEKFGSYVDRDN